MKLSPDDAPIPEADFRFPFHFTPSSAAILFFQAGEFADAYANGYRLNVRNLFQYIKILHEVTTVPLFQERCQESGSQNPVLCGGAAGSVRIAAPAPGAVPDGFVCCLTRFPPGLPWKLPALLPPSG